ncbi:MAG: AAA family ATPase [Armatimonadota bacterium]
MTDHDFTLVLVGPHGVGKTTLGQQLSARLGIRFHHEIGQELRENALISDPGAHAMRRQDDFDEMVSQREIKRDQEWSGGARIVETWHPGNLAYAAERSPRIFDRLFPLVQLHVAAMPGPIFVQPLTMSRVTALKCLSEPVPNAEASVEFFAAVYQRAVHYARSLGMNLLDPIATDCISPGRVEAIVLARLRAV